MSAQFCYNGWILHHYPSDAIENRVRFRPQRCLIEIKENIMEYKTEEKDAPGRGKVKVLTETYEKGEPQGELTGRWVYKLRDRQEKMRYLKASMK